MASDQAKELRKQGIAAAKAGQVDQARQLLQQSLRIEPQNEASWLWLVSLAKDQREKMFYLNRLLEINPNNEMGLQALKALGMTKDQLVSQVTSLPSRPDNRATLAASASTTAILFFTICQQARSAIPLSLDRRTICSDRPVPAPAILAP